MSKILVKLVAYPMFSGSKPTTLGTVRADKSGVVSFELSTLKLYPGQYTLRALSASSFQADLATTFFQVLA